MSNNCERIRRRALEHGVGSVEYDVWVRHSQHCAACRSEVYLQELLYEDAKVSDRLSSSSVTNLIQLANQRYGGGRRRHERLIRRLSGWCVRVAVFVGLVYGISLLSPRLFQGSAEWTLPVTVPQLASLTEDASRPSDSSSAVQESSFVPLASSPSEALSDPEASVASSGQIEGSMSALQSAEDLSNDPELLSGWSMEHRLQDFRQRMKRHRHVVSDGFDEIVSGEYR